MEPKNLETKPRDDGKVHVEATFAADDVKKVFEVANRILVYQLKIDSKSGSDLHDLLIEKIGAEALDDMYAEGVPTLLAAWVLDALDFETVLEPRPLSTPAPVYGAPYTFSMEVTRKPSYELSSYDPVEIERPVPEVPDEAIDGYLVQFAEDSAKLVNVQEDRPVRSGDHVIVDIRTVRGLEPVPALTADQRGFDVGEGWFSKAFDDNVIGMRKGDTKTFSFEALGSASRDANDTETLTSTVTVEEIQEREVPEIDDEWVAREVDGAGSVDGFRKMIRDKMLAQRPQGDDVELLGPVADELAKRLDVQISDELYQFTINEYLRRAEQSAARVGKDLVTWFSERGLEGDKLNDFLMTHARTQILRGYALDAYYRHFDLGIDDSDIDAVVAEMAGGEGSASPEALRSEYEQGGRMYILREAARRLKANKQAVADAHIS